MNPIEQRSVPVSLRRTTALLAVLTMALTACDAGGDVADSVRDAASEIASDIEDATSDGGQPADGTDDQGTTSGEPDGEGTDGTDGSTGDGEGDGDAGDGGTRVEANDLGPVGANGKPMLQASYPNLVIEVDVQDCTSSDAAAVDHLVSTLRSVVDKPGGVILAGGNTFSSDRRQWTASDLRGVAEANRSNYSTGDTVAVYVLYACGAFHADGQETSAIGAAYNASEFAVFPQRWNDGIGALLGSNRAVERAVLVHEAGHLFGLVNLTYRSEIAHEDPDHPGHSSSRRSVMYWAIESTAIGQVFSGPPPDTFDEADRADLEGLKSGKY